MIEKTFQLGDFELSILSDGVYFLDGGALFGIIPKALWKRKMECDERNRVSVGLNSVLIRTSKQNILIETGIGNKLDEKQKSIFHPQEKLLTSLRERITPEQVDIVINSHLHFDHCGWNTVMKDGTAVATFPNALYYAPEGEWRVAKEQRERDRASYLTDNYDPLIRSGQMQLIKEDMEIVPGIALRNYPGHTRSMMAVMMESGGKKACYISDLIPTTAHIDLTWGMSFDLYPLETIENKKRFYKEAIPGKWLVIFTHDPNTPYAYLEAEGSGKVMLGQAQPA